MENNGTIGIWMDISFHNKCGNTATRTVTVTAAPSAGTLSGTQAICVGGTSTFTSTVTGGAWTSSATGVATINSSTGSIAAISAGIATMTYTVTGSGGCANATATRTVTVTAAPSAGTLSGTQSICVGGTSTFDSMSGEMISTQECGLELSLPLRLYATASMVRSVSLTARQSAT